jgi:hypothetical protein
MVAAVATAAIVGFGPGLAADHRDGPRTTGDPKADINDVYAFRSPENDDNVVFALTVNPLTTPAQNMSATLDESVSYDLNIDGNNDLVADVTVRFRFTGDRFTVTGLGDDSITGAVTPLSTSENIAPVITTAGGIRIFVGLRDDPFIMDLNGIKAFLANPQTPVTGVRPAGQTPVDAFGGTNVSMIVVELPASAVTGGTADSGTINAWGSTSRGSQTIDRMAIPGLNVLVVPEAQKDNFNSTAHADSTAEFGDTITSQIEAVRASVTDVLPAEDGGPLGNLTAAQVSAAVSADAVTIDFSKPLVFPNGRRLQDDVVNAALGLVLNRGGAAGVSDAIDTLDKPLLSTFPYAAPPHLMAGTAPAPTPMPGASPVASGPIAAPDTGSGGVTDESSSSTTTVIALGVGALLVAVGAGVVLRRRVTN